MQISIHDLLALKNTPASAIDVPVLIIGAEDLITDKLKTFLKRIYGDFLFFQEGYISVSKASALSDLAKLLTVKKVYFVNPAIENVMKLKSSLACDKSNYYAFVSEHMGFDYISELRKHDFLRVTVLNNIGGINSSTQEAEFVTTNGFSTSSLPLPTNSSLNKNNLADEVIEEILKSEEHHQTLFHAQTEYSGTIGSEKLSSILQKQKYCSVKYLYKAKPEDVIDGLNIGDLRIQLGSAVGSTIPNKIAESVDYVVPVPNSGIYYAVGVAHTCKTTFLPSISKVNVASRGFEIENVDMRRRFLTSNITVNKHVLKGKNIILVDEAIFTGATLKSVCEKLLDAGVGQIHIAIPSPACVNQCEYFVQPKRKLLLEKLNESSIANYFGAQSVFHLDFEEYNRVISRVKGDHNFCNSCFAPEGASQ